MLSSSLLQRRQITSKRQRMTMSTSTAQQEKDVPTQGPSSTNLLMYHIVRKNWKETIEILENDNERVAQVPETITRRGYYMLWKYAPAPILRRLFHISPEIYEQKNSWRLNFIEWKMFRQEWEVLSNLIGEFPQISSGTDAKTAAFHGASIDFVNKYWDDVPYLSYFVTYKNWKTTIEILNTTPHLARQQLTTGEEFSILWKFAPVDVVRLLLMAWPDVYKKENSNDKSLIETKMSQKQWDFLHVLINEFPSIIDDADIKKVLDYKPTVKIFQQMLQIRPNAPLIFPEIIFLLIYDGQLALFKEILEQCPAAAALKEPYRNLTPLLAIFDQGISIITTDWIGPILAANVNAAKDKDFDGKYALHLAYQYDASVDVLHMISKANAEAETVRDNLGRTPKELSPAVLKEESVFTPIHKAVILGGKCPSMAEGNDGSITKTFDEDVSPNNENNSETPDTETSSKMVVVCRGDALMRDPSHGENITGLHYFLSQQLYARHQIFETLLDEFSKLIGQNDKDVIQKAATIQALALSYLSQKEKTVIDFKIFHNPGYWYQQEMLKLVMRIYGELQGAADIYIPDIGDASAVRRQRDYPPIFDDAQMCLNHLNRMKQQQRLHQNEANSAFAKQTAPPPPPPSSISQLHVTAFDQLKSWLTDGLGGDMFAYHRPTMKPLQSLFNKLFIRRGQTSVNIVGDMVRATLYVHDVSTLQEIINKIEEEFPNITEKYFVHPEKMSTTTARNGDGGRVNGTMGFLNYVQAHLKFIPDSDVLPYRFKKNSSQKKRRNKKPKQKHTSDDDADNENENDNGDDGQPTKSVPYLWYNLNFFIAFPELYSVGQTDMFVAYELQIGLTDEIQRHRKSHIAYEKDRILSSQSLLQNYLVNTVPTRTKTVTSSTRYVKKDDDEKEEQEQDDDDKEEQHEQEEQESAPGGTMTSTSTCTTSSLIKTNCSDEDIRLIEKVLTGRIATEIFVVGTAETSSTYDNANNKQQRQRQRQEESQQEEGKNEDDDEDAGQLTVFEEGPFVLSFDQIHRGDYIKPKRICINNRYLNWTINGNDYNENQNAATTGATTTTTTSTARITMTNPNKNHPSACVIAGPYNLDSTKRYFVESMIITGVKACSGTVGLCAHVGRSENDYNRHDGQDSNISNDNHDDDGSNNDNRRNTTNNKNINDNTDKDKLYMIHVSCGYCEEGEGRLVAVESGNNLIYLERTCILPIGTTAIEIIEYGGNIQRKKDIQFEKLKISLQTFS